MRVNLFENLNKYQKKAVTNLKSCLIEATVGSGKTAIIICKAEYLTDKQKIEHKDIAIITHSNKAANEIKTRLGDSAKNYFYVGTIHGFAFKILRENYGFRNMTVITPEEEGEMALELIEKRKLDIKYVKNIVKRIASARKGSPLWGRMKKADDIRKLLNLLQIEKSKQLKFNFDELLKRASFYLKYNPLKLDYILVDEFQDVGPIQYDLIKAATSQNTKLFVVGDPNQEIYSFNGGGNATINKYIQDYKPEIISLPQNYRSNKNILKVARIFKSDGNEIITSNESGNKVIVRSHVNQIQESLYLVNKINELVADGKMKYSDIAILFRTQKQSEVLEETLKREGIAYEVSNKKSVNDVPCLKWVYLLLKVCGSETDSYSAIAMLSDENYGENLSRKEARKVYENYPINSSQSDLLDKAMRFEVWSEGKSAKEIFDYFNLSDNLCPTSITYTNDVESVKNFLSKLDEYCKDNNLNLFEGLKGFLCHLDLNGVEILEDSKNIDNDAVKLMTLHASKGLEFKYVFIIGVNDGLLPLGNSIDPNAENIKEEERVLYVGITRAKENLELSYYTCPTEPMVRPGKGLFLNMIPAEYIEEIDAKGEDSSIKSLCDELRRRRLSRRAA